MSDLLCCDSLSLVHVIITTIIIQDKRQYNTKTLIKIRNARLGKFHSFAKNLPISAKFAGNLAVFIGKSVSKFLNDSTRAGKVMVAFLKHSELCN